MENATTTARRRALASASGIVLGLMLGACSAERDAWPAPPAVPAADSGAALPPPEPALEAPAPPRPAAAAPVMASAAPERETFQLPASPLSTSGPDATLDQVWGDVVGGNAGAAESCGAGAERIAAYREKAQRYIVMRHMKTTLPDDYLQAYERARQTAAAIRRGADECREILAALDG